MMNQLRGTASRCANLLVMLSCVLAVPGFAQTAKEVLGAAAVEPIQNEPPPKIVIDPPLAEPLSHGRVVIQYRTENLHLVPVFGPAALSVSPRVGHVHVSLDNSSWVWVAANGDPVILNGLLPGPHKVLLQLESANHQLLDQGSVAFTVPVLSSVATGSAQTDHTIGGTHADEPSPSEPPAKLIVDAPKAEPLSRGVLFLTYRAEHLRILPVFGTAALALSPHVGHIHVTVDDATWHWADASGVPIIINGLTPGWHKVLIQLVNANHRPMDQQVVTFEIPN